MVKKKQEPSAVSKPIFTCYFPLHWQIDVEGHEEQVLRGAVKLLHDYKVIYILSEISVQQESYLRLLLDLNYKISFHAFDGPFASFTRGKETDALREYLQRTHGRHTDRTILNIFCSLGL